MADGLRHSQPPVSTATLRSRFSVSAADSLRNSPHLRNPRLHLTSSSPLHLRFIPSQTWGHSLGVRLKQLLLAYAAVQAQMLLVHFLQQRTRSLALGKQSHQKACLRSPLSTSVRKGGRCQVSMARTLTQTRLIQVRVMMMVRPCSRIWMPLWRVGHQRNQNLCCSSVRVVTWFSTAEMHTGRMSGLMTAWLTARESTSATSALKILCSLILSTITSNFAQISKIAFSVTRFSLHGVRLTSIWRNTRKKRPGFAASVTNPSHLCRREASRHTWTDTCGNRRVSHWLCAHTVGKSLKRKRTWTTTWPTTIKTTPFHARFLHAPKPSRTGLVSGSICSAMEKKHSSARCVVPNFTEKLGSGDTCRSIMGNSFAARSARTDSVPTTTWSVMWRLFTRVSGSFLAALAIQSFIQVLVWRYTCGGYTQVKSHFSVSSVQPSFS